MLRFRRRANAAMRETDKSTHALCQRRGRHASRLGKYCSTIYYLLGVAFVFLLCCIYSMVFTGSSMRSDSSFVEPSSEPKRLNKSTLAIKYPPIVERSVIDRLDEIALRHPMADSDDLPGTSIPVSRPFRWPPIVTSLPDPTPESPLPQMASLSTAQLDTEICGTSPCRFLLPLRICEQESKARIHFMHLRQLAVALDRILVLPNVGKSRIGACYRWEFDAYYSANDLLVPGEDGVQVVTQKAFREWTNKKPHQVQAQLVQIQPDPKGEGGLNQLQVLAGNLGAQVFFSQNDSSASPQAKPAFCTNTRFPNLSLGSYNNISIYPLGGDKTTFGDSMIDALYDIFDTDLAQFDRAIAIPIGIDNEPDVLLVDWNYRRPLRFESLPPLVPSELKYSLALTNAAKVLAKDLGQYLAVHWRMEGVPPDSLPSCARSLVRTLHDLLLDQSVGQEIVSVWFATDNPYPLASALNIQATPKSGTFKKYDHQHAEAIAILQEAFDTGNLTRWKVLELDQQIRQLRQRDETYLLDLDQDLLDEPGVRGILDKLIASNATLFVNGSKGCAKTSSFTKQIIDTRKRRKNRDGSLLRNIVESFGR